ncbi:MAG TPA: tRNA pseudouridine(55) synthase TruB [Rhodospirillaceae bacterium]|nr:tRNA pseudouridine(55) synthase TruB [Rhodospirillaceae bacterium]
MRGIPIHGWVAIDKPLGLTSTAVVGRVRRILNAAKVGHGGTLDPLASGVLPIALGEATKTVPFVMDGVKTYRFGVRWGEQRSTDDGEGVVIATSPNRPAATEIEAALTGFLGVISQQPPIFSALKLDGQRAYDLARAGAEVTLAPRKVRIDSLTLLAAAADEALFEVTCGKGTYVRALARDLGLVLGTFAYVASLRRTRCGPFAEERSISLDKLEDIGHSAAAANYVLPVATALDDIPALALTEDEARRLQSGQFLSISRLALHRDLPTTPLDSVLRAMDGGRLVALARIDGEEIRPVRVFNL